jgi:long-chain acyl-CoA synthetase
MENIDDVLARCQRDMTAPGAPFELVEQTVNGRAVRAYRHAARSLPEFLDAGRAHGDKEFMVYEGDRWTFARLFDAADALAWTLYHDHGLREGDRVAIAMRNRPEWAVAFVAVASLGAVPAPVNSFGMRDELLDALRTVEPKVLVCDRDRLARLEGEAPAPGCMVVLADAEPLPDSPVRALGALVEAGRSSARARRVAPQVGPDDPALILFTSGATSRAKGVLSTQRAVCQSLYNLDCIGAVAAMSSPAMIAAMMARGFAPTLLTAVPLFHVSGLHAQLLASLRHGRRLVLMHRWDPQRALELIREEHVTQFNGAPSMLMQLLEEPGLADPEVMRSLSGFGAGGAGLPQRAIERMTAWEDRMAGAGFGMTETNGVGAGLSGEAFRQNPRCSGVLSPIVEVRIVGLDGTPQPCGSAGEIWLRGVTLMQEYWRNPKATAEALDREGWLRTGDVGYLDEHGRLYVIDRIKDVINRNGEKIAAAEVESCLMQHPDVREAAVIGVPDDAVGESIVAVVVPHDGRWPTEAQVEAHVRAHLAAYKVPSRVHVLAEALPRNAAGKLLKASLKARYGA